ncbi:MAG: SUMF1/EgtB/PvdO family nonheme iron enzyme [Pyrinomonadaceae bacterium]
MRLSSSTPKAAVVAALLFSFALAFIALPLKTHAQDEGLAAGRSYALVIGNNTYQHIRRLKTAEDDAREVAAVLQDQYGFQTKLLLNANRQQIISAINSYRRELDANANLLIYYAGHGVNDKDIDKAYWLPVDATLDDNSNWISADDITNNIRGIPARHVLIVSDSCYSGTLTRGLEPSISEPVARQKYLQKMMAGKSRTLMASGGNEPVADGGGGNHSIFANALLRGLTQADKRMFTAGELFQGYIQESVAGRAEQTPEYNPLRNSGHDNGDFVFVRVKVGGKTVEVKVSTPASAPPPVSAAAFELSFWDSIKTSTDAEDYREYLAKYPNGQFASIARRRAAKSVVAEAAQPANRPATNPAANTVASNAKSSSALARRIQTRGGMELVLIPAGSFMMGSTNGDADEKPVHRVDINYSFYMGRTEVTQAQWQAVMGTTVQQQRDKADPKYPMRGEGDNNPMYYVSWDEAQAFIQKLNQQDDGYYYRLPSEAEWEYACRAGTTGDYAGDLDAMAWYGDNSGQTRLNSAEIFRTDKENYYKRIKENGNQTHAVGSKVPNSFGLYDMHGNVNEWCADWYHDNYNGAPTDGSAWVSGGEQKCRVLRGGSWVSYSSRLRSAFRVRDVPGGRFYDFGFRVVAVARN